ncbi:PBP1A family penicillin-binding protein [Paenibacillus filicis]|uniref:PBP1A family penicillin-binding protein n=1 Tax=Paenibacillus gyeongsangnamensis TaxID=3388067 RepID=A0ABT4Q896_9BACL|nr:PBP1A family penicillin-binding protein [Paenibacillus filicis]MCZ8513094.1 PBP1A family penicillin-binding protein [Paenibacillus filicis]
MAGNGGRTPGTPVKPPGSQTKEKKPTAGKKKKKSKVTAGKVLAWTFVAAALAAICAMGVYIFIIINGDRILKQNIDKLNLDEGSIVYDANGAEVATLAAENREVVDASQIPERLKQAFIATEDRRFEEHTGIDFLGIGRALVKDVVARSMVEGGSTITQQLAKNVFLSADKTFFRKGTEMSIAVALEHQYKKDDILALYLNRIFFGNRAYGIKAASKKYFGISDLNQLKLWQMATLAAMPKAPNTYNPISNPEKAKERRGVVLKLMQEQGYITEAERAEAAAVDYSPPPNATNNSSYQTYVDYVLREAQDTYKFEEDDILRNGYKIYTNLDPNAQKIMEQTYANDKFFQKDGPQQKMQSSMVILNNKDAGIVAMIGGRDYVARGLNRATQQPRQPGSSFKTLIAYAPALESGKFTPYSQLPDEERTYPGGYAPRNYDGVYRGSVDMFEAIKRSINAPAVWLLNEIGVKTGTQFVSKLGIQLDPQDNNLAIALGGLTKGVTTMQMAQAYSTFANNGYMNTAHAIVKIVDSSGKEVAAYKTERKAPVMSAKTAWYMTQLMQGVVEPGGTGTAAKFDRPVAGKTGSTQLDLKGLEKYNRDLWFVGYTPEWTAAVWMGFDKTDSKHYVSMSSGAPAAIFREVMSKSLAKRPMTSFQKPDSVPDVTESKPQPPKSIGDLKAEYLKEKRTVHLSWSPVGDNVTYQLFRKGSKDKDFPAAPMLTTASTDVNDITAFNPDMYQYVVVPLNGDGTAGARSNVVEVTVGPDNGSVDPLHPGQPGNGQGQGQGQGQGKPDPNNPQPGLPGQGGKPGAGGNGTGGPGSGAGNGGTGNGNGGIGTGTGGNGSTGKPGTGSGGAGGSGNGGNGTGTGGAGSGSVGTGTTPGQGGSTLPGTTVPGGGGLGSPAGGTIGAGDAGGNPAGSSAGNGAGTAPGAGTPAGTR